MTETASFLDSHPKLLFNIGSMWESYIGFPARGEAHGAIGIRGVPQGAVWMLHTVAASHRCHENPWVDRRSRRGS